MSDFTRVIYKFTGYYVEDCQCCYCLHFRGKVKGCKLAVCCCSEEKSSAIENGRIKRRRGKKRWDL